MRLAKKLQTLRRIQNTQYEQLGKSIKTAIQVPSYIPSTLPRGPKTREPEFRPQKYIQEGGQSNFVAGRLGYREKECAAPEKMPIHQNTGHTHDDAAAMNY